MKGFGEELKPKKRNKSNKESKRSQEKIINQAIKFHMEGNISEAAKYYQDFITQGFNDPIVFSNYGLIMKNLGRYKEAEVYIRKAIKFKPNFAQAHLNLGLILKDLGKSKEAELSVRKAIEIKADYAIAHSNLGNILRENRKFKEAELSTRKAIELKPDFAEAYSNLGNILRENGKLKEAELSIRKAIKLNANLANAHYSLGGVLKDLGKFEEAELSTLQVIKIIPDFAEAHSDLGNILRENGKLKEAELSQRKAIELKPDFAEAYLNLGCILKDLSKLKEAELYTRKSIELKPDFAEAHCNLGNILRELGKLKEAELYIREAIKLQPIFANAHLTLGIIMMNLGKIKEAEIYTRKAINLNSKDAESYTNLGGILTFLGKSAEAENITREAIKLNPYDAASYTNLGSILKTLGKIEEAEIATRKAIKLKPSFSKAHINLGEILFDLGKVKEASTSEWNAIKSNPQFSFVKSYRENAKLISKTAFYIYSYTIFNHFRSIIEINPNFFEILIPEKIDENLILKIRATLKNEKIRIRSVSELIKNNQFYQKLVSNLGDHEWEFIEDKNNVQIKRILPTIKLFGKQNIRFMYTAGKNKYTISSYWNKYYDGILCYGPYHENKFKIRHQIATSQMGYPRFDKYYNPGFEKDYLLEKFKCDPKKKTIVWLTTWSDLSSIDKYIKSISSLKGDHNVVLRPHPNMKTDDPENYKKLSTADFNFIDDSEDDNVQLYALADLMFFDYGGSMFGSLYLNKNFAFLEMELESKNNKYLGELSSEDYFKSFFPERIANLENLNSICDYCLKNPPSSSIMNSLREEFFNMNYQGNSSERAYELLCSNNWLK